MLAEILTTSRGQHGSVGGHSHGAGQTEVFAAVRDVVFL
jgi:hypothetical protein